MQERLGFNTFRTGEATPTILGVLGLKGELIKAMPPDCSHLPLCPPLKSLIRLRDLGGGQLKSLLIFPHVRLGPHKPSLSPYHPHISRQSKGLYHVNSLGENLPECRMSRNSRALQNGVMVPHHVNTSVWLHTYTLGAQSSFRPVEYFHLLRMLFVASVWDSPGLDLWDNFSPLRKLENCTWRKHMDLF